MKKKDLQKIEQVLLYLEIDMLTNCEMGRSKQSITKAFKEAKKEIFK